MIINFYCFCNKVAKIRNSDRFSKNNCHNNRIQITWNQEIHFERNSPNIYNGTLVIQLSSLYSESEVRTAVCGLYFSQKDLKLFALRLSPDLTSMGMMSSFSFCIKSQFHICFVQTYDNKWKAFHFD